MFRPFLKFGSHLIGRIVRERRYSTVGVLPDEVEQGFNDQIAMEYFASFTYFAMAMNFGRHLFSLPGCHKFFLNQYQEEREHAEKLAFYLLRRGNKVALKKIETAANKCWESPLDAFKDSLELESAITKKLFELRKLSKDKGDLCSCLFVESHCMDCQMEEYDTLSRYTSQLEKIGDDAAGIFLFDRKLLKDNK